MEDSPKNLGYRDFVCALNSLTAATYSADAFKDAISAIGRRVVRLTATSDRLPLAPHNVRHVAELFGPSRSVIRSSSPLVSNLSVQVGSSSRSHSLVR